LFVELEGLNAGTSTVSRRLAPYSGPSGTTCMSGEGEFRGSQ